MNTILASGLALTINNPHEVLSMGGPFIGELSIGTNFISEDCLVDNYVFKEYSNLLFFIKYHRINLYQYFTINFYNPDTLTVYEFDKEFDMVYLGNFRTKNELEIYHAFHDKFPDSQHIFNLDTEIFSPVK